MEKMPSLVSVIVPVKDEIESIPYLADEIRDAFEPTQWSWECIWVDDGSKDQTLMTLKALHRKDPRHRYLSFDRNHGQTAAMLAGFSKAAGEILATLDGDGQNDPSNLPAMIRRILAGDADMVNGIRAKRQDNWIRKISSKIANGFRNWITREDVTDVGCSLRAFRTECVAHFPPFEGMHRFFPTMVRMYGWKIIEVPVRHRPRLRGKAKYGVCNRLWRGLLDSFAVRWMQWRQIRYRIVEQAGTEKED